MEISFREAHSDMGKKPSGIKGRTVSTSASKFIKNHLPDEA
jgi:hypothetical protein